MSVGLIDFAFVQSLIILNADSASSTPWEQNATVTCSLTSVFLVDGAEISSLVESQVEPFWDPSPR